MTDISVQNRAELELLVTEHQGAPNRIGRAFDQLVAWAGPRGLLGEGRVGVAIYLTDIGLPESEQRSLAGLAIPHGTPSDDPSITSYLLPGGRHAVALHKGPYAKIGDAWRAVYAWIAQAEEQPANLPAFEVNLNNPRSTPPEHLLTEVCVPLADRQSA